MTTKINELYMAPFQASDAFSIKPRREQMEYVGQMSNDFAKSIEIEGLSYTFLNSKNEIVSVLGVIPVKREGIAWAIHSDLLKDHGFAITKAVRNFFKYMDLEGDFDIFRTSVKTDFKVGHKWAKAIGFKRTDVEVEGYTVYERKVCPDG